MNIRMFAAVAATALVSTLAHASPCGNPLDPTQYLVFSRGDILYAKSDFQGMTGTGQNISLQHFEMGLPGSPSNCTQIVAGQNVTISAGSVLGGIESGGLVKLRNVNVRGKVKAARGVNLVNSPVRSEKVQTQAVKSVLNLGQFYLNQSAYFASQPDTSTYIPGRGRIEFPASPYGVTYISIRAEELAKFTVLHFSGTPDSTLIINVRGASAAIARTDIQLLGIPLGRVLMNFPEAVKLDITASGSSQFGIPATILAPYAATGFWNGLISGGLYVGSLCGDGQINSSYFGGWVLPTQPGPGAPPGLNCPPGHSCPPPQPPPAPRPN